MLTEIKDTSENILLVHSNIMLLKAQHGDIVGITHTVTQNDLQSTNIFFFNGFVYTINELFMGVPDEKNSKKYFMLYQLISEMPLMIEVLLNKENTFLMDLYIEHETKLKDKTIIFVFSPPYHILPKDHIVYSCRGLKTIEESNNSVYFNENTEIIEAFVYTQ